jgi:hypothetical protein
MERHGRVADGVPGPCAGRVERPCSRRGAHAAHPLSTQVRQAPGVLTIPAAGSAPSALRRPPCWRQPPRLRGQSQVLQDGAHPLRCRHVRQHLAPATKARAREHAQRERPAQQPSPIQLRLAPFLRLLHPPRQRRRAHSLHPRLYIRLRELACQRRLPLKPCRGSPRLEMVQSTGVD